MPIRLPALKLSAAFSAQHGRDFRRRSAFTVMEVMFALIITSLLVLGMLTLFIVMLRATAKAGSLGTTSLDSANAIQKVSLSLRQARSFALLDNSTYDAVDSSGNVLAVTGLSIVAPAAGPSTSVVTTSGGSTVTLTGTSAIFDRTTDGTTLNFYRSDVNGNPQPSTGSCLWMSGIENGTQVSRAIVRTIAAEADAVQFIQPYQTDGATPIQNAVEISLVTSVNSGTAGTVSSHSSAGGTTVLTGDLVYLRDHNPTGVSSLGVHGHTHVAN